MNRFAWLQTAVLVAGLSLSSFCLALPAAFTSGREVAAFRVAVIGFTHTPIRDDGKASQQAETLLTNLFKQEERTHLIERSLFQPALTGIGYAGAINLSRDEAKRVGAAVGCDFFITGKAETFARSERAGESHVESFLGLMIVDGRSGQLVAFDFINEKAATAEQVLAKMAANLAGKMRMIVERMSAWRAQRLSLTPSRSANISNDLVEVMPDESSLDAKGFRAPEFLNRVKPDYTAEADLADITATVEAMVVFSAKGEIGEVEILRWAGFGLDESAIRAIKQLKFKPAQRDGQPVSVRAQVRYNFRRAN